MCVSVCGARRFLKDKIQLVQILVYLTKFRSCISHNVLPPQQGTTQSIVLKI